MQDAHAHYTILKQPPTPNPNQVIPRPAIRFGTDIEKGTVTYRCGVFSEPNSVCLPARPKKEAYEHLPPNAAG